jgi:hypothetical protein
MAMLIRVCMTPVGSQDEPLRAGDLDLEGGGSISLRYKLLRRGT